MANETVNRSVNIFINSGQAQNEYDKLIDKEKKLNQELAETTNPKKMQKLKDELSKLSEPIERAGKKLRGELLPSLKDNEKAAKSLKEQIKETIGTGADATPLLKQLKLVNAQIKDQAKQMDVLKQAQQDVSKEGGMFSGAFFGNLAANGLSQVVGLIKNAAVQSYEWAKQALGVENAFAKLNQPGLLNELRKATRGTVSDLELMKAAVKADNFKIPLEQLGTLLKFAQQRARDTGESVEYLAESIVLGISRKSIPIMDNLGISATALQKEVKKTGDFAKAAFNIVNSELAKAGPYAETAADKIERIKVAFQNAATSTAQFALKLLDSQKTANQLYDDAVKETENYKSTLETLMTRYDELKAKTTLNKNEQAELQGIINKVAQTVPQAVTEFDKYGNALDINKGKITAFLKEQDKFLKLREKDAIEEQTQSAQRYAKNIEQLSRQLNKGTKLVSINGTEFTADLTSEDRQNIQSNIAKMQEGLISTAELLKQKYKTEVPAAIQATLDAANKAKFGEVAVNNLLNPKTPTTNEPTEEELKKAEEARKEAERKRKAEYKKILEDQKRLQEELAKLSAGDGTAIEKEMFQLNEKYDNYRELAHGNADLLTKIEEQYQKDRLKIIENYSIQVAAAGKKYDEEEIKKAEAKAKRLKELMTVSLPENVVKLGASLNQDKLAKAALDVLKTSGKDKLEAQKRQLEEEMNQALANENLTAAQKALIREQYLKKIADLEDQYQEAQRQKYVDRANQMLAILNSFDQAKTQRENAELERDRKLNDKKKSNLERQLKSGVITQLDYDRKVQDIEQQQEKRQKAIALRQFRRQQRLQAAQAAVNGAQAIMKTLSEFGPPVPPNFLGIAAMAFTVGATLAEIGAIVTAKPPEFARGGYLRGPSHANGGVQLYGNGGHYGEAEGGEVIINKRTVADRNQYTVTGTPSQIASGINALHGGVNWDGGATVIPQWRTMQPARMNFAAITSSYRRFADGGVVGTPSGSVDNTEQQTQTLVDLANTVAMLGSVLGSIQQKGIPAYTLISQHNSQQERLDAIKKDATMK